MESLGSLSNLFKAGQLESGKSLGFKTATFKSKPTGLLSGLLTLLCSLSVSEIFPCCFQVFSILFFFYIFIYLFIFIVVDFVIH